SLIVQLETPRYAAASGSLSRRRGALPGGHTRGTASPGTGMDTGAAERASAGQPSGASAGAAGAAVDAAGAGLGLRPGRRRRRRAAAARGSDGLEAGVTQLTPRARPDLEGAQQRQGSGAPGQPHA